MSTQIQIKPPANLDPTVLHSPAEVDAWHSAWADYREALQAEERRKQQKEAAEYAHANRILTRDEYHQRAVKEEAERRAKEAEREAARQAKEAEKQAYLESQPEVVEILENNPYSLLLAFQHRVSQGYELPEDGIGYFVPGCFSCKMVKATPAATRKK